MPRPLKPRFVSGYPVIKTFVPERGFTSGEVLLSIEGMESIRLSDFEGLDQDSAAKLMKVSRQTYGRILSEARSIVANALVTGKILRIGGGMYEFRGRQGRRHRGRGKGKFSR